MKKSFPSNYLKTLKNLLFLKESSISDSIYTYAKLVSILAFIFIGTFGFSLIERIKYLYFYNGTLGPILFICFWIFCCIGIVTAHFIGNKFFRFLVFIIFYFSTLISVVYIKVSGAFINYDNLYVLIENAGMAQGAIHEYVAELLLPVLASVLFIGIVLPVPRQLLAYKNSVIQKYSGYVLVIFPFFLLLLLAIARGGYGMDQLPVQYAIPALTAQMGLEKLYFGENKRNEIPQNSRINSDTRLPNIVLIVDESQRGDYLDINSHSLSILPSLVNAKDKCVNFGLAASGGNLSAESNQILRFGPNPDDFYQTFKQNPYVWNYARKAGYKTVYLEGQVNDGVLNDRITPYEKSFIDSFIYITGAGSFQKDEHIATTINELLRTPSNKPLFIYAVKSGMHFPYDILVPQEERIYKTQAHNFEVISKTDMVHSYVNAVHYINNHFFGTLFSGWKDSTSVLIYTSDHGQNLLDNGRRITHGSKENTSIYEGLVPLIVFTGNQQYLQQFSKAASYNKNKANHFTIVPTLLSLWGYQPEYIRKWHGYSLFDTLKTPRKFLAGLISVNRFKLNKFTQNQWITIPDSVRAN